jgi:hypothetical protein
MIYDPLQSSLGDCYLIAAMSSVASRPNLIERLFVTPEANTAGIYTLKLYVRGKPWLVQVDDELPFMTESN